MKKKVLEFLRKQIPAKIVPIYIQEFELLYSKYGVLKDIPITLQKSEELLRVKIEAFLKVLEFLEIKPSETNFFWLIKLYFSLPLKEDWSFKLSITKKKLLVYRDKLVCRLRPSIGYIYYLMEVFVKFQEVHDEMANIIERDQINFYHFFRNKFNQKTEFYNIKSKYINFLDIRKSSHSRIDYARLNYFTIYRKKKTDREISLEILDIKTEEFNLEITDENSIKYLKEPSEFKKENFMKNRFDVFKSQQDYLKFKFSSLLDKKKKLKDKKKIFKIQTRSRNSNFQFQKYFNSKQNDEVKTYIVNKEIKEKFKNNKGHKIQKSLETSKL